MDSAHHVEFGPQVGASRATRNTRRHRHVCYELYLSGSSVDDTSANIKGLLHMIANPYLHLQSLR